MPYQSLYEKELNIGPYKLNQLLSDLYGKKINLDFSDLNKPQSVNKPISQKVNTINQELMEDLPLYNVRPIKSEITKNSYRGSSPFEDPSTLKIIKAAGINTIVDLCGYYDAEELCKENGLGYCHFRVDENFYDQEVFKNKDYAKNIDKEKVQEFLEKFVNYIKTMQKDNVYIGCEFGKFKTDNALLVNSLFNPAFSDTENCVSFYNKYDLPEVVNLYKNLTPEHKKQMGWSEEFDAEFMPKLEKIMEDFNVL